MSDSKPGKSGSLGKLGRLGQAGQTGKPMGSPDRDPSTPSARSRDVQVLTGIPLCAGLVLTLFFMRFFYVAESADQGETLGIVGLWLVVLLAWFLISWRRAIPLERLGWFDFSVGLLAAGHLVSALVIVASAGDKRSAVNLAWEWLGVATGWFLFRQLNREASFRRDLLAGLIATGVCVAGLGLYQHYVAFPAMGAKYGPLFDRLRQADASERASLRRTLANENIPTEEPAITLFEKRLRDSREPLGFFALANNFGGFLAVCLILTLSIASRSLLVPKNRTDWCHLLLWLALLLLLGWALLLTKSRTAWIGTTIGLGLLAFRRQGNRWKVPRIPVAAGLFLVLILASWGLFQLGGLDRQVLTEAPKSLQYRLQYWIATSRMIQDHVLLGVGPGQFRGEYLFYKLPEASEEISDPHNLFLDVTANGGLCALCGLVLLCGLTILLKPGNSLQVQPQENPPQLGPSWQVPLVMLGCGAVGWVLLLCNGADDRLLILIPVTLILFILLRGALGDGGRQSEKISAGCWGASLCLLAHLCGAGGIGMPTISLLLLALISVAMEGREARSEGTSRGLGIPDWRWGILAVLNVGLILAWFYTGWQPVTVVQQKQLRGDQLLKRGDPERAEREFLAAGLADDWISAPWRQRAEMACRKAEAEQYRSHESCQKAVDLLKEARLRDPSGFRDNRRLGEFWFAKWQKTGNDSDLGEAVQSFQNAWKRYPTNSTLMAELAFLLARSNSREEAEKIAMQAIKQDTINHQRGHVDRFLPDETRRRLDQLIVGSAKSD